MKLKRMITVVTVCRNAAAHIGRCVRSVAAQTFQAYEHVVVDGASSDGTPGVGGEGVCPGARVSRQRAGPGIYDAMNKGLARAKASTCCFLALTTFSAMSACSRTSRRFSKRTNSLTSRMDLLRFAQWTAIAQSLIRPPRGRAGVHDLRLPAAPGDVCAP